MPFTRIRKQPGEIESGEFSRVVRAAVPLVVVVAGTVVEGAVQLMVPLLEVAISNNVAMIVDREVVTAMIVEELVDHHSVEELLEELQEELADGIEEELADRIEEELADGVVEPLGDHLVIVDGVVVVAGMGASTIRPPYLPKSSKRLKTIKCFDDRYS